MRIFFTSAFNIHTNMCASKSLYLSRGITNHPAPPTSQFTTQSQPFCRNSCLGWSFSLMLLFLVLPVLVLVVQLLVARNLVVVHPHRAID